MTSILIECQCQWALSWHWIRNSTLFLNGFRQLVGWNPGGLGISHPVPIGGEWAHHAYTPSAPLSSLTRAVPLGRSDWVTEGGGGMGGARLVSDINHVEYKILDRWSRKKAARLPCDQCFAHPPNPSKLQFFNSDTFSNLLDWKSTRLPARWCSSVRIIIIF